MCYRIYIHILERYIRLTGLIKGIKMNRFLLIAAFTLTVLSVVPANAVDNWTLMVYLDADSNLHSAGLDDITEMESCSTNPAVNIIVLFDGACCKRGDTKCDYECLEFNFFTPD